MFNTWKLLEIAVRRPSFQQHPLKDGALRVSLVIENYSDFCGLEIKLGFL